MRVVLVTPAPRHSRAGNRTTAVRWARFLRGLGHRVRVTNGYAGESADLMLALHAWRSAEAAAHFRDRFPQRPLVVALTGTDIYRFIDSDPDVTLRSMELADALVGLHDLAAEAIPARLRDKVHVIYQSVPPLSSRLPPLKRVFEVLVIGHLREEKDPLRTALATRDLPSSSRIRVVHLGRAHDEAWAERARAEMARNPRYRWRGEVPGWAVRRALARAPLMVLSSVMEGGANVVSEALVAGVPVIASDIPGSVGLLGRNYPGYYPVRDTDALRAQLLRAEQEPDHLAELQSRCAARAPLFEPRREREAWRRLLARVTRRKVG
ncbi:MAG: TIGR04348 family glycosyltransferase [Gammaproteobacteria bacterium]|nr:TIGR04348 family glycosyltransferase [Gammaproteobacteria bacterium]NIR83189.1 TIGR04348 family glycosyltransferase [Gammaproteobacteria bacterium]NIR90997.1 TIGR04348 family glycosyltransferase [Gammaproteobacteria bacterium]NIU04354.1 TIGR04348 family glycosyltransferase [Gammaproteobacteria bacterium]NIV52577.1 TIGR04348 family glycosyltransferase [Gammaproteobacteria bacterium]